MTTWYEKYFGKGTKQTLAYLDTKGRLFISDGPRIHSVYVNAEKHEKGLKIKYKEGFIAGLKEYAWWKEGVQYVGTCGITLEKAIEQVLKGGE